MSSALRRARQGARAILAANFYNAETLLAVLRAARRTASPVIVQTSPATIAYLGLEQASAMARAAARELGVEAYLHLDHAREVDLARRCLEVGYDSVMIDASETDFDANVECTRAVVRLAHEEGKAVEAELGYVPKVGQSPARVDTYTTPDEARAFVEATGVDLLAVAVGSAHGFYEETPRLDYDRLTAIRNAVDVPLVLHGSSGLGDEQLKKAIERGICKINFATEIKDTFMRTLKGLLSSTDEIDIRKTFPAAIEATTHLVEAKMRVCKGV